MCLKKLEEDVEIEEDDVEDGHKESGRGRRNRRGECGG